MFLPTFANFNMCSVQSLVFVGQLTSLVHPCLIVSCCADCLPQIEEQDGTSTPSHFTLYKHPHCMVHCCHKLWCHSSTMVSGECFRAERGEGLVSWLILSISSQGPSLATDHPSKSEAENVHRGFCEKHAWCYPYCVEINTCDHIKMWHSVAHHNPS